MAANIGIENSAEDGDFLNTDSTGMYLLVENGGLVSVKYSGIMKTTCTPDAYYYPFDVHTCSVVFVVFGYSNNEIHLDSLEIQQDKDVLLRHAEWEVEIGDVLESSSHLPTISVNIQLRRRATNIFLTTLLPLFMLVFLQVLVFVLPAESGERISYSITMFLSYAVFMTIVAESVPPSNPVTLISNFLTFLLVKGAMILILNIMILNIHHKDKSKTIPKPLRMLASCMFYRCRKMENDVHPEDSPNDLSRKESFLEVFDDEKERIPSQASYTSSDEITWPMVAHALDITFFIIFISTIVVFFTIFYFVHYF
ncbi:hypothetical protein FSP39_010016 [Pinctada imbricata]|uniref:Uncharacterized protein n=1 Tax=Pinctada imbricata TaxID=66713 RepID=A0AA88XRB1_PINIB|nr:hypothetical protein FSP39_010016 [Pinctada imbricata]